MSLAVAEGSIAGSMKIQAGDAMLIPNLWARPPSEGRES
jgi:hypothetical protein